MISGDVRRAIGRAVAAAGLEPADPGLRPTGTPGQYGSSVAFAFGEPAGRVAARLAALLAGAEHAEHIARAEVTGPGFITITVTPEALAELPERIITAGPACASSDALRGLTVPAPPPADPLAAPGWDEAATALAAQLTARLAAAAGATVTLAANKERAVPTPDGTQSAVDVDVTVRSAAERPWPPATGQRPETGVAAAVAFAGADAVLFSLARAVPGRPVVIDPLSIARQVPGNPAYAVRYAHARAVTCVRWAARSGAVPRWRPPAGQRELVLVDALSWLPEKAASAARRARPDEFARYLEELAGATIAALSCAGNPAGASLPAADRLALAGAARTGLAAGLGLLGVSAPDRA